MAREGAAVVGGGCSHRGLTQRCEHSLEPRRPSQAGTGPGNGSVGPQAQPASKGRNCHPFSRLSMISCTSSGGHRFGFIEGVLRDVLQLAEVATHPGQAVSGRAVVVEPWSVC